MNPFENSITKVKDSFIKPTTNLPKAIIVDLDGTLSINPEGLKYNPYQSLYKSDEAINYKVNQVVLELIREYPHKKLIVTAREGNNSSVYWTKKWLLDHNISYNGIWFRDLDFFEKDFVYKKWVYEKFIKPKYSVDFVLEDKATCKAMYTEFGLRCVGFGIKI